MLRKDWRFSVPRDRKLFFCSTGLIEASPSDVNRHS